MNISGSNPIRHQQFEVKDEMRDMPDEVLIQKGRDCANASKGAEAAAFVRAVKDPVQKEDLINEILEILAQLNPKSDQGYDAMSSFVQGLPSNNHSSPLNAYQHFEVKDELKDAPDEVIAQKGKDSAKAYKGAEAAAFVRAVKDPVKKEALVKEIFAIINGCDQSSAQTYDLAKSFVEGITLI